MNRIVSKREANKMLKSAKQDGRKFVKMKFCTGKYKWHGSVKYYEGKEISHCTGTLAIWAERRQDSDGPYIRLMCYTEPDKYSGMIIPDSSYV